MVDFRIVGFNTTVREDEGGAHLLHFTIIYYSDYYPR